MTQPVAEAVRALGDTRSDAHRRPIRPAERPLLAALGRELEATRVAAGLTLEDLAPYAGSPGSLRDIERGRLRTRARRIRAYCAGVGVDPEPIIARYASVIAPERADGRDAWRPVVVPPRPPDRLLAQPPMEAWDVAALGAELWRRRALAGLTRPALAARLGCWRAHVWMVEHGQREPSPALAGAWLAATGTARRVRVGLELRFPGRFAAPSRGHGAPGLIPSRTNGREPATNGRST